ncbi:MAG: hypothetical protein AAF569_02835 [Pseudomonadota bacterium]
MKDALERRKMYGIAFLMSGLALGGVGLLSMWMPDLVSTTTLKIIFSLIIAAALSCTLFMLTFANEDGKLPKKMSMIIGASSIALAAILFGEVWFDLFEKTLLGKLVVTLLVISALAGFVITVWEDFFESKKLKDEGYLD